MSSSSLESELSQDSGDSAIEVEIDPDRQRTDQRRTLLQVVKTAT